NPIRRGRCGSSSHSPLAAHSTSQRVWSVSGSRRSSASHSSSRTGLAPAAISALSPSYVRRQTGYALLLVGTANAISATLYERLNFIFIRDIVPVAGIARVPEVMLVNPSLPATTVRELIDYANVNPGKLTMASGGIGTLSHVEGELFKMMTGVNLVHVPYRGLGPALTDLLGGQVQVMFASMSASIENVRANKLRIGRRLSLFIRALFSGAVKLSPPKRLRNASAVSASGKQNR